MGNLSLLSKAEMTGSYDIYLALCGGQGITVVVILLMAEVLQLLGHIPMYNAVMFHIIYEFKLKLAIILF